jgi:hypothetical protein
VLSHRNYLHFFWLPVTAFLPISLSLFFSISLGCATAKPPEVQNAAALETADIVPDPPKFSTLLSAAFADYAKLGDAYSELHFFHLGVHQPAPNTDNCSTWPKTNPGNRILRLGFVSEVPLHTVDSAGHHVGFEADLAVDLVKLINNHYPDSRVDIEWVLVDLKLPVGPTKNVAMCNALIDAMRADKFDIAFSCSIPTRAAGVSFFCDTMSMFPGIKYTGLDSLDVSSIHDRNSLVQFLVSHKGLTFVHGMGVLVYEMLAADVRAAGGSISNQPVGMPHFRMADIIGLAKVRGGQMGLLLDVNPRTTFQPKSIFTLNK